MVTIKATLFGSPFGPMWGVVGIHRSDTDIIERWVDSMHIEDAQLLCDQINKGGELMQTNQPEDGR